MDQICEFVDVAHKSANDVVRVMRTHGDKEISYPRGVLRLTDVSGIVTNTPCLRELISFSIGELSDEKRDRYHALSLEKTTRLAEHLDRPGSHASSYQSRSPARDQWGGAIIVVYDAETSHLGILSFSGLKEDSDEALVLLIASRLRWLRSPDVHRICNASHNSLAYKLLGWDDE